MVFSFISDVIAVAVGAVYPAFRSFKAMRSKDGCAILKWSKYWTVFASYLALSSIGDILLLSYLIPGYEFLKLGTLFYIVSPWTCGSDFVYDKFVAPFLENHDKDFDQILENLSGYCHGAFVGFIRDFFQRRVSRFVTYSATYPILQRQDELLLAARPVPMIQAQAEINDEDVAGLAGLGDALDQEVGGLPQGTGDAIVLPVDSVPQPQVKKPRQRRKTKKESSEGDAEATVPRPRARRARRSTSRGRKVRNSSE